MVLKGTWGIGKSTLLKQFLFNKMQHGERVLYISADSALLDTSIADLALEYHKRGAYIWQLMKYTSAKVGKHKLRPF